MNDVRVFRAFTDEFIEITGEEWNMFNYKYLELSDLYNGRYNETLPWPIALLTEKGFNKFKIFHERYTINTNIEKALTT